MFTFKKKVTDPTDLETEINRLISTMNDKQIKAEDYNALSASVKTLMEAREIEKKIKAPFRPSPDAVAGIAGTMLSIATIIVFEKTNVITTKSLPFVPKIKT